MLLVQCLPSALTTNPNSFPLPTTGSLALVCLSDLTGMSDPCHTGFSSIGQAEAFMPAPSIRSWLKGHLSREALRTLSKEISSWDAWVAQSVEHLTSGQVMISQFMGSSATSGSGPTARSLEPALDSVYPSLSAPPLLALSLKINKHLKVKK